MLANLFLHYGMDLWMTREYPGCGFERFADDAVIHCVTERQAYEVRDAIGRRFADIGLSLHPEKTKIVYCADSGRRREQEMRSNAEESAGDCACGSGAAATTLPIGPS